MAENEKSDQSGASINLASVAKDAAATEDALGTATKAIEGVGTAAEENTKQVEGLRIAFSAVKGLAPELGEALLAMLEGPAGAAFLLGSAVKILLDKFEEYNEQCRQLAESTRDLDDILSGVQAMDASNAAMDDHALKASEAADATERLATATENLQTATEDSLKSDQDAAKFSDEESQARERLAIANVKAQVASGELTAEQGARKQREIHEGESAHERRAESAREQGEIDTLTGQRTQQAEIDKGLEAKKANLSIAADDTAMNADTAKRIYEDTLKKAKTAEKAYRETPHDDPMAMAKNLAKMSQLDQLADQQAEQYKKAAAAADAAAAAQKANATELEEGTKKNAELDKTIREKTAEHQQADSHRAVMADIEGQTTAAEDAADQSKVIMAGVRALDAGKINEATGKLDELFNTNQAMWQNFLFVVKYHQEQHTSTAQEVAALKNLIATFAAQNGNAGNNYTTDH